MKIYLAGTGNFCWQPRDFYNFYRLESYLAIKKDDPIERYKDFILDSGIFSYLNGKKTEGVDWDKYVYDYAKLVRERRIRNYVEVDVDKMIGLKETERLRRSLEKQVGWKSMPVWHTNRGYDKWLEICRDYDYVCFGAFLTDNLSASKYHLIEKFISDAQKENTKVHGLGFTNFNWLKKLKFYSVDSSSWLSGVRYGHLNMYQGGKIVNIHKKEHRIKDIYKLAWHNFNEWLLFSNYAETHL